jgi:hypothetical protein
MGRVTERLGVSKWGNHGGEEFEELTVYVTPYRVAMEFFE